MGDTKTDIIPIGLHACYNVEQDADPAQTGSRSSGINVPLNSVALIQN